jgi:hypothetical protein
LKIQQHDLDKYLSDEYDDFGESCENKLIAKRKVHPERTDREFEKPTIIRVKQSKEQPKR